MRPQHVPREQPTVYAMAAALERDRDAPIRGRVAAVCCLHRRRWGLACYLPDERAVRQAYRRRVRARPSYA